MSAILSKIREHDAWTTKARPVESRADSSTAIRPQWLVHLAEQKTRFRFDKFTKSDNVANYCLKEVSTTSPSETSILARVAANDRGAMERCIQQYSNLVWNLVKRRVASHSTAEDLVQEIFTEIWKTASRYDANQGKEATFIGMIARRRTIDWTRKQMNGPVLEPLPEQIDDLGAAEQKSDNGSIDGELVTQAVEKLPEQTRQLFHLHFDQGLTQQEIASVTEMPLGTVKTLLRRGLLELRTFLAPHNPSSPALD